MSNSLLPVGSSALESAVEKVIAEISALPVALRQLCNPATCPAKFLPWLAWAFSVDRWDEQWPEVVKRQAISDAYFIHRHKGTINALRRVVEPFGYLIRVIEWWQTDDIPGTFRIDIGVQDSGITEETFLEIERLIADAKPLSRHLLGLNITLDTQGAAYVGAITYSGDALTVYPYFPETITVSVPQVAGAGIHFIDTMSVTA